MKRLLLGGIGRGALLVATASSPLTAQEDSLDWSERMAAGDVLEISSIRGDMRVVTTTNDVALVTATKYGVVGDFDRIEVRVEQVEDGFRICVVHDPRGETGCGTGDGYRDGGSERELQARVEFQVELPAGVSFVANSVMGSIDVRDVASDVTALTVTGNVSVSKSETVWTSSVSGSIEVEMGVSDWDHLAFNTVSGDITLWLPSGTNTDVQFESLSGEFESELGLVVSDRRRGRFVGSYVRGSIGDGGRWLSFHTVSGDVRLATAR